MPRRFSVAGEPRILGLVDLRSANESLRREVLANGRGKCAIPRCPSPAKKVVQPSADVSISELPLGLCGNHAQLAESGAIGADLFLTLSRLQLSADKRAGSNAVMLHDRPAYLGAITRRLSAPTARLYAAYVGPLPLHPDWYFAIRDASTGQPNMDVGIRSLLRERAGTDVRIVFRNVERYRQKLEELVTPTMRGKLKDDMLAEIDRIWGEDGSSGPQICCFDTGPFHIPTIFDDCAVTASRETPGAPITEGVLVQDPTLVEWEAAAFNRLFDGCYRGQATEVFQLRSYVEEIS